MFKPVQKEKNCVFNSGATTSHCLSIFFPSHLKLEKEKKKVLQEHLLYMCHETLASPRSSGKTPSEHKDSWYAIKTTNK